MYFLPKFFYDDNAHDTGGGAQDGGSETKTDDNNSHVNTNVDVLKPLISEEELKEYGFDSPDQFREHLRQTKENRVPDEVKKKNAEKEKAEFLKVATDEGLMNVDEYTAYESVTKRPDRDLVYEKFAEEYKAENPDATDEVIRADFNLEYKLDSENAKIKARGEARLKKEADEMRSPLVSKYNEAKSSYDQYRSFQNEAPAFNKFIDDLVQELTPDTFTIAKAKDGDDEIEIPVKFTKEQREEIAKLFRTHKTYLAYADNKDKLKESLSPKLTKKINDIIKVTNFDNAINYTFTEAKKIGIKKGSNVGAEQPYSVVKSGTKKITVEPTVQQSIDESDANLRRKYAK